ncbi:class E sortase [Nocardiopsis rhodophaea]
MVSTSERRPTRGGRRRAPRGRRGRSNPRMTVGDIARGIVRLIGELLFTAGVLMLFFAAYEVYGKQFETQKEQNELAQGLEEQWKEPKGPDSEPLPGSANARMYIPDLDLQWVVVNGVSQEDIKYSPGHYTGNAEAGQPGNYAVAGHRTPGIFWDLDQLDDGDTIVLEDQDNFYTYEVIKEQVVTPDNVWVVDPDPFDKKNNDDPERSLLTLTTCAPKLNNTHRLIVWGELSDTRPKDQGMPESIADMAPENADA